MDYTNFKIQFVITAIVIILFMIVVNKLKKKQINEMAKSNNANNENNSIVNNSNVEQNAISKTSTKDSHTIAAITAAVCTYLNTSPQNVRIKILESTSANDLCVRSFRRKK